FANTFGLQVDQQEPRSYRQLLGFLAVRKTSRTDYFFIKDFKLANGLWVATLDPFVHHLRQPRLSRINPPLYIWNAHDR
ncbi:hypothetical protein RN23_21610, partial [Yersinia pestis subsp. microtus bv. Ulegeica]